MEKHRLLKLIILISSGLTILFILFWPKNIIYRPVALQRQSLLIIEEKTTEQLVNLTDNDLETSLEGQINILPNQETSTSESNLDFNQLEKNNQLVTELILLAVPFISQAPNAQWSDPRFQDACEEASAIMAMKWVKSETLSNSEAVRLIEDISNYLLTNYQEYRDSSAQDTIDWIFKDYFNYHQVSLTTINNSEDLINILRAGQLIIAPMNGQVLDNPFFTPPGPDRHMLVIRGYNPNTQEFITNDPGTRHGEAWAYPAHILLAAIRDYPSGYKEEIQTIEKNIIIIKK